jgi:hypothetical protein
MNLLLSFYSSLLALLACNSKMATIASPLETSEPSCIQRRIDSIKQQPVWNPPAEVHEYEYNGKKVYLFSANCCDQFNTLMDANCNYVCAPSGGFTGKGDRKCNDFYDTAKHLRLVWKDERVRK